MENLFINIWKKAKRKRKKELTFWEAFGSILVMALADGGSRSLTFVTLQEGHRESSQGPRLVQALPAPRGPWLARGSGERTGLPGSPAEAVQRTQTLAALCS